MSVVEHTIDVDVPVRVAYDQWTQFETFPKFMEGVERVVQKDDKTLEWHANIAGQDKTWTAEIIEQTPDQRIAWRSTSGATNAGVVSFTSNGQNSTRVTLQLEADPEGPVENVGDALGFLDRRVKGDLDRFKEFVEGRGVATGSWRGEVHGGEVERS
ncbi:MAG TPA: SRPBCC family protein [Clostridia bacterium]|nr:SRPBCC family protein [Clostridia bacterium]